MNYANSTTAALASLNDPYIYFEDSEFDVFYDFLMEETENVIDETQKKGFMQHVWDVVVKAFGMITRTFDKIISWLKKLFHITKTKKPPKTVDQILEELGIPRSKEAKDPNRKIPWDTEVSDPKIIPTNIDLMMKPLMIEFENDSETMTIKVSDQFRNMMSRDRQGTIRNTHKFLHDPRAFMIAMEFMKEPELVSEMEFITDSIVNGQLDRNTILRIDHIYTEVFIHPNISFTHKVKMGEIESFNKRLATIQRKLSKSLDDTTKKIGANNDKVVKALNNFSTAVLNLQLGVVMLGTSMRHIYVIDQFYAETIHDIRILDQFVSKMIDAGVPDKYVAFNCWIASMKEIKGDADPEHPCWGTSRLTFFPPGKDAVYKIAINGWGIRGNLGEKRISDAVYKAGVGESFAKVYEIGPTDAIVTMEKATIDRKRARKYVEQVKTSLNEAIKKAGIPGKIGDVSEFNVAFRGPTPISIDYGLVTRLPTNGT